MFIPRFIPRFTHGFLVSLITVGCQTPLHKAFNRVEPGLKKDQVLELIGSPKRSQRYQGKDRWTYEYFEDDELTKREIIFENGVAVYVGDPLKPQVSAEEQDRLNEESNTKADLAYREQVNKARAEYEKFLKNPHSSVSESHPAEPLPETAEDPPSTPAQTNQ